MRRFVIKNFTKQIKMIILIMIGDVIQEFEMKIMDIKGHLAGSKEKLLHT